MKKILGSLILFFGVCSYCFAATVVLENFENLTKWSTFKGPKSLIGIKLITQGVPEGKGAMEISYNNMDWNGVGMSFTPKQKWTIKNSLSFSLKGSNSKNKIRLEIADNQGERFEYQIVDNFNTWKKFNIPIKNFKRRADWQPNTAPNNGLTLSAVEGLSISWVNSGKGTLAIDNLVLE